MSDDKKDYRSSSESPGQRKGPGSGGGRGGMAFGAPLGGPVEKAKNFSGTLKRLLKYLKPHSFKLIIVVLFTILSTIFSIVGPKILGKATTKLFDGLFSKIVAFRLHRTIPTFDFKYIGMILLILIVLYLISAIFSFIQQYIMSGVSQKTVFDMRRDVYEKLNRLPLKYFDSRTHGEIMSRITNDIDNISTTLQQSLTQLISSVFTIIGIVVMMLTISPILTLITFITLPLSFMVTAIIAKRSQKYFGGTAEGARRIERTCRGNVHGS